MSRSYKRAIHTDNGNKKKFFKRYSNKCIRQHLKKASTYGQLNAIYGYIRGKLAYDVCDYWFPMCYNSVYTNKIYTVSEKWTVDENGKFTTKKLPKDEWHTLSLSIFLHSDEYRCYDKRSKWLRQHKETLDGKYWQCMSK